MTSPFQIERQNGTQTPRSGMAANHTRHDDQDMPCGLKVRILFIERSKDKTAQNSAIKYGRADMKSRQHAHTSYRCCRTDDPSACPTKTGTSQCFSHDLHKGPWSTSPSMPLRNYPVTPLIQTMLQTTAHASRMMSRIFTNPSAGEE